MKLSCKSRINRLENILRQAYCAKNDRQVGEEWQKKVLQQIRQVQPVRPWESLFWGSGRLAWQIMPATCVLALLVGGVFLFSDAITSADLITMLYGNTQGTAIDTIFYTCVLALLVGGVFLFSDAITSADMITILYGNTQGTAIDTIFYM